MSQTTNRATFPGLVNAHSHAFQRIFRGQTEEHSGAGPGVGDGAGGNFWTWREAMYRAANALSPEDLYAVARMAFLEMALSGITTVAEFHYIHRDREGHAYSDPNLISKLMVRAAREVGLRICLLRVAYARAGFQREANPLQKRFIESSSDEFLRHVEALRAELDGEFAWVGVAPHSVRAVPLAYLREVVGWAKSAQVPVHMHASEQPAELDECRAEYGTTPIALWEREGFLSDRFTAVHGIHVSVAEIEALALAKSFVCACPTTERNLGDGIFPAADYMRAGVRIALGSDSQVQIDLLEDARELEYHLRLSTLKRGVLDAKDLFQCATENGAESLKIPAGSSDHFTVDVDDVSIAGSAPEHLLATVVFGMSRTAVRDVVVGGERIVREGRHELQETIIEEFVKVARKHRMWKHRG